MRQGGFGRGIVAWVAGALAVFAVLSTPALAVGPGLPRTYQVQRIDSPAPAQSGQFSLGMNLAGDLNGDGEEDLVIPQVPGFNTTGQLFIFSGENGALLDTVNGPDPSAVGGQAQFGLLGNTKAGLSRSTPPFTDLGSCAGGQSGQTCPAGTVGAPDGRPELLIGATGVDAGGVTDAGRVYVVDGATRAILKRIDIPVADRTPLALTTGSTGFGRETGTAEGQTGCAGNSGVGSCPAVNATVEAGDMDGGGRVDVIVGARRITENSATAHPDSHCASVAGATCRDAGRAYIYRGEEIVGSNPAEILDGSPGETVRTLRNPTAQADDQSRATNIDAEGFGNDIIPIGDVGTCTLPGVAPGDRCPRASSTSTPDNRPDVVISSLSTDLPLDDPDPAFGNAGVAHLIDGATGAILHTYVHPEPQAGASFGGTFEHTIAAGDMGESGLPDVPLGAPTQNAAFTASGRMYVMNGNFRTGATLLNIARLDDPTPDVTEENFGGSSAGVGDLVGGPETPANELMVGESGPRVGPVNVEGIPIDVHFFSPSLEQELQSIPDPDAQSSSAFGDSIEPMGDVNEDGYLDFAVGAFRYTGTQIVQGRVYIFRSDNSPVPGAPAGRAPSRAGLPTIAGCPPSRTPRRLISLTAGNDRQNGTVGGDTIFGGAGDDVIDALAGDDCVDLGLGGDQGQGGGGNDLVLGGGGGDSLSGNAGNDRLLGGSAADRFFGGFGNDRIHGQSGSDRAAGSRGRDRMNGGRGNDRLAGDSSADRISGDSGNDRISGGSSNDTLRGNSGNDRISGGAGRDRISCGRGTDTVIADSRDRVGRDCERVRR